MSIRPTRSSWPVRAVTRAGLLLLVVALAACAGQEQVPPQAGGSLFARGFDKIDRLYLEPVSNHHVALAGAKRLSRLDDRVAIADAFGDREASTLTISYDGRDIAFDALPRGNDADQWGALLAKVIATAKQASPKLAALPAEKIDKAVFDGMTLALDRFSRYSAPGMAREQRAERDGFGGVGVTLDTNDRELRIAAVSPLSPAARAGIKPEDQIVAINGIATKGCTHDDAIHQLRGPIGSAVALRIVSPGEMAARDLRLQRALVTMPTVSMSLDGNIAVFQISSFNRTTAHRLAEDLAKAEQQTGGGLAGVVLDLRGNPGGLLDQAVKLAELFIPNGPIVSTVGRNPASYQYFPASGHAAAPRVPIAVLINGGSASASEIVAAALQDTGRAVVIGSASFGKGTVQTVLRLPNNGDLILTWARLVTPSGYLLQHHGVVPTLCTARLPEGGGSLPTQLQQAAAVTLAGTSRPRAGLDERGWTQLRQLCPPLRTRPQVDLKLAERLLADPKLYSEALHALPTATRLAQGARPAGRTLP